MSLKFFFALVCFSLSLQGVGGSYQEIQDERTLQVFTPAVASVRSAKIRLSNGLEFWIISDPNTKQSGALLSIGIGSWSTPDEFLGLPHYLEHMLFMGTKTYPDDHDYFKYIQQNGGIANAYTADQQTAYYFTVDNQAFEGALDRFSRFFSEPLFDASCLERERHAVDQEYALWWSDDSRRDWLFVKSLANPDHPFHKFSVGSLETLSGVDQKAIKAWYEMHYSADLMRGIVYSSEPLEALIPKVVKAFEPIASRETSSLDHRHIPILNRDLEGKIVYVEPLKELRELTLYWEISSELTRDILTKPENVVAEYIAYEGKGSLAAHLKEEGLINSLACEAEDLGFHHTLFFLKYELTPKGLKKIYDVLRKTRFALLEYQKQGIPSHFAEELKAMSRLNYQYQASRPLFGWFRIMGYALHREPLSTYPERAFTISAVDMDRVNRLLQDLSFDRAHILLKAPKKETKVPFEEKEPWSRASYAIRPLPDHFTKGKDDSFLIVPPSKNPFIPEELDLTFKGNVTRTLYPTPKKSVDTDRMTLYFAEDKRFGEPKVCGVFQMRTPLIHNQDAESVLKGDLYVHLLKKELEPLFYQAGLAGLQIDLKRADNGIEVRLYGYEDKFPKVLDAFLKALYTFRPDPQSFARAKETLYKNYRNFGKENALDHVKEQFKNVWKKEYVTIKEKEKGIKGISYEALLAFSDALWQKTFIEGMLYGAFSDQKQDEIVQSLKKTFPGDVYPKEAHQKEQFLNFPIEEGPLYYMTRGKAPGNGVMLTIHHKGYSPEEYAAMQIIMQSISAPFFNTLRTKQQTAYLLRSSAVEDQNHLFSCFLIQSNTHCCRDLLARFELFIEDYVKGLGRDYLDQSEFEDLKQAFQNSLNETPKNTKEMGAWLYQLAFNYDGEFQRKVHLLKGVENLTYDQCLNVARTLFDGSNPRRLAFLYEGAVEGQKLRYKRLGSLIRLKKMGRYH